MPKEDQIVSVEAPGDFSLDLSKQELPSAHMAAHLRMMLRDGIDVGRELATFMDNLSIKKGGRDDRD